MAGKLIIGLKHLPWGENMLLNITVAIVPVVALGMLNNKVSRKPVHELRKLKKRRAAIMSLLQLVLNTSTKQDRRIIISQLLEDQCLCRLILIHPSNNQWEHIHHPMQVTWDNRIRGLLDLTLALLRMERHIRTLEDTECKVVTLRSVHMNITVVECTMANALE